MKNLKRIRLDAGLEQTQLAELADVPVRQIRSYEAEALTASVSINKAAVITVKKLADALGCRIEDLMEET